MASSWRQIPFLRWSFWRLMFGMKRLTTEWQVLSPAVPGVSALDEAR